MVIDKQLKKRSGIAMIELIFALVIMGIVLMSAPMLIQQSIKSENVVLQQEAIVAAASQTDVILSMYWDENNNSNSAVSPMFDVNRMPFDFNSTNVPRGLQGVMGRNTKLPSGFTVPATPVTSLGMDQTNNADTNETDFTKFDDVDDYDGSKLNLTVFNSEFTTADIGDYVDTNLSINTIINYAEDRPNGSLLNSLHINITPTGNKGIINSNSIGSQSNIKFITVNLTSNSGIDELDKNITFKAFSCNIGATQAQGDTEL